MAGPLETVGAILGIIASSLTIMAMLRARKKRDTEGRYVVRERQIISEGPKQTTDQSSKLENARKGAAFRIRAASVFLIATIVIAMAMPATTPMATVLAIVSLMVVVGNLIRLGRLRR